MTHVECGTAVHALAEKCLETGEAPKEYIGKTLAGVEITKGMASSVSGYLAFFLNGLETPELKDETQII